jgi:hypothetical protein
MAARYNWWQDYWECDTYEEAFETAKETQAVVFYRENDRWKEFQKIEV